MPQLPETNRSRRGHAFYPTAAEAIPALYATDRIPVAEKMIVAHYFVGGCDWWITEYNPADGIAFGYACLGDPTMAEWGYVSLVELEEIVIRPSVGLPIPMVVERDLHWNPTRFPDIRHACIGDTRT
jgi:hypothetical protein